MSSLLSCASHKVHGVLKTLFNRVEKGHNKSHAQDKHLHIFAKFKMLYYNQRISANNFIMTTSVTVADIFKLKYVAKRT